MDSTQQFCMLSKPTLLVKNYLKVCYILSSFPHHTAYSKPVWHDIQAEYFPNKISQIKIIYLKDPDHNLFRYVISHLRVFIESYIFHSAFLEVR